MEREEDNVVQLHPLENFAILHVLFQHSCSTFDSVKTSRLVCKTWKEASLPQWKSYTIPIKITQNESNLNGATSLTQYMQSRKVNKSLAAPNRNFVLSHWKIKDDQFKSENEETHEEIDIASRQFWNIYGSTIKILSLQNTVFIQPAVFTESFFEALPNLERLTLANAFFNPVSWTALMSEWDKSMRWFRRKLYDNQMLTGLQFVEPNFLKELGLFTHEKLKSLRLERLETLLMYGGQVERRPVGIPWETLIVLFPNLEEISVRDDPHYPDSLFRLHTYLQGSNVKLLDVMKLVPDAVTNMARYDDCGEFERVEETNWFDGLTLTKLHIDVGFLTERQMVVKMLETQARTLQQLHLYRAPFSEPYSSFPCEVVMARLTKLHLWGNVSQNLDFLRLTPNLRELKWNTSCYEENDHGKRVHPLMESRTPAKHLLFKGTLVESTKADDIRLTEMETLEMDWGQITVRCWERLGKWMPNLQKLKGTIKGDEELAVVAKQWHDLEVIEVAHGSGISATGILHVLKSGGFKNLMGFKWKGCPCIKESCAVETEDLRIADEEELQKQTEGQVILPWTKTAEKETECAQMLFEHALLSSPESDANRIFKEFCKIIDKESEL